MLFLFTITKKRRRSKCQFNWPPFFYSTMSGSIVNIIKTAPLRHCFANAINFSIDIFSSIIMLFLNSRPTTIIRLIIPIVINPINRMFDRWFFSHIFKKLRERFTPTLAHFYATTTIVFPTVTVLILSPIYDMVPSVIERVAIVALGISMFSMCFSNHIGFVATAGFCYSKCKIGCLYYFLVTAITNTNPSCASSLCVLLSGNDDKASITLPFNIDKIVSLIVSQATAGFCMAASKIYSKCCGIFSAIATAKPLYMARRTIYSPANYNQKSESFTREIFIIMWNFFLTASTRFAVAIPKMSRKNDGFISTFAATEPTCRSCFAIICARNNSECSKFLTDQIDKARHNILRQNIPYNGVCGRLIRFQLFGSYPIHTDAYSKVGA